MRCPECNGRGETIYYVEIDRDADTVTVEQRKDICRTCNGSGEKPMTNAEMLDIHIPCRKCGELIPAGGGNYCLTCRLRSLNDPVFISMVMPKADYIRSMSDEELAMMLMKAHDGELHIPFCKNKDECFYALDHDHDIKKSECLRCMMEWLKEPAEVDNG